MESYNFTPTSMIIQFHQDLVVVLMLSFHLCFSSVADMESPALLYNQLKVETLTSLWFDVLNLIITQLYWGRFRSLTIWFFMISTDSRTIFLISRSKCDWIRGAHFPNGQAHKDYCNKVCFFSLELTHSFFSFFVWFDTLE